MQLPMLSTVLHAASDVKCCMQLTMDSIIYVNVTTTATVSAVDTMLQLWNNLKNTGNGDTCMILASFVVVVLHSTQIVYYFV